MNIKTINYSKEIARVVINEPKTYNSLSYKNLKDLINVFKKLDKDKKIKVVILEGAGKGFSAGHNLKEVKDLKKKKKYKKLFDLCSKLMLQIVEGRKPVIAKVHIVDKSEARLKQLVEIFGDKIIPEQSDQIDLKKLVAEADLLVGGVLIPGAEAPKLITKDMLKLMKRGSVIVDVAIDQGGCVETSKPTTHGDPTYIVDDVVHYCVANMPGGVPRTSTFALNTATLPFLVKLANKGYEKALGEDKNFLAGLNVYKGEVTYKAVADVFNHEYSNPEKLFN